MGGRGRVPVPGFQASAQGTWAETSGLEVGGRPLALWPFADLPVSTRRNPHPCNIQGQLLSRNSSFVTFTQVGSQHLSLSLEHFLPQGRPRVDTPGAPPPQLPAATGMNSVSWTCLFWTLPVIRACRVSLRAGALHPASRFPGASTPQ